MTGWPDDEGLAEEMSVVAVAAGPVVDPLTVWVNVADVLAAKLVSPV